MTFGSIGTYHAAQSMVTPPAPVDNTARTGIDQLQYRLERQTLVIQTLLMILLEKKVIHEDEFKQWMAYVDELDGMRDGRLKEDTTPVTCPSCSRKSARNAPKCAYCGAAFSPDFLVRRPPAPG